MSNHHGPAKAECPPLAKLTPELQARLDAMRRVDSDPQLAPAASEGGVFGCYLRNRLRSAFEAGEKACMQTLALQAVDHGAPELAEGAAAFLEKHYSLKAGEGPYAEAGIGPITWGSPDAPGTNQMRWQGTTWGMLDYRDKLMLEPWLLTKLAGEAA